MKTIREDGYYWIRFEEGLWQPAEWLSKYDIWLTLSSFERGRGPHMHTNRIEVGERIIKEA